MRPQARRCNSRARVRSNTGDELRSSETDQASLVLLFDGLAQCSFQQAGKRHRKMLDQQTDRARGRFLLPGRYTVEPAAPETQPRANGNEAVHLTTIKANHVLAVLHLARRSAACIDVGVPPENLPGSCTSAVPTRLGQTVGKYLI